MEIGSPLIRIAADWDCSQLLHQTPGGKGIWDAVQFTTDDVVECDYLILLNNRRSQPLQVLCPLGHVWCVMQEPYVPGNHDWMTESHEQFARVFTHHVPRDDQKYVRSHPLVPWWVGLTYDELVASRVSDKTKSISYIASNQTLLAGHRKRNALREFLLREAGDKIDIFGRGIRYIEDKWNALAPYRYSIAIENSNALDYWTEKLADCFLSWTVPLYDGCPNIEDYFPADSLIRIDATDQMATVARIEALLHCDEWETRLPALQEARRRVLETHQMFPFLARAVRNYGNKERERTLVNIAEYIGPRWKNPVNYFVRMPSRCWPRQWPYLTRRAFSRLFRWRLAPS
jgi:Glycosyltransferase family 10 (fucosyltransferase) C-term